MSKISYSWIIPHLLGMHTFFSTLAEINQSYVEQLRLFWIHIPELTQDVQNKTEWIVSRNPQTNFLQNEQITPVFDFPKIPPHISGTHGEDEDDISYVDFAHHIRMQEKEYKEYAWHEFANHINELNKDYHHNFYLITYINSLYLKRYWHFLDKYLTLLEKLELNINEEKHSNQEWNVFYPWTLSSQKKEYDNLMSEITYMEKKWDKEKVLLTRGFENIYLACLRNEQYWSIIGYFTPNESPQAEEVKKTLQTISDSKISVLENIWIINKMVLSTYRTWTPEFRIQEHAKVRNNVQLKNPY